MLYKLPKRLSPALLLLLTVLASGCSTPGARVPQPAGAPIPAIPPLSPQPALPTWCVPTCLDALQVEQLSWLEWLTNSTPTPPPAPPASGK